MVVPAEYRCHLLASGKSAKTIRQRTGDIDRFSRRCIDLFAVTTEDLVLYLSTGAESACWKPEYLKKIRASFRSFYRWAHLFGRMNADPAYGLSPVTVPKPLPHPTPEVVVLSAFLGGCIRRTVTEMLSGSLARARVNESPRWIS